MDIFYFLFKFWDYIIYALFLYSIIRILVKKGIQFYHSHWNKLINNFDFSTEEFYQRFKKELLRHKIKGISTLSVSLHEGNIFSSKRRYIRVNWKEYQYDICAAPFGDGFFISWWLLKRLTWIQIILSIIPIIGPWLVRKFFTITYYRIDTANMMMNYCHQSALKVIDEITDTKGVRKLTEDQ